MRRVIVPTLLVAVGTALVVVAHDNQFLRGFGLLIAAAGAVIYYQRRTRSAGPADEVSKLPVASAARRFPFLGMLFLIGLVVGQPLMGYAGRVYPNSALIVYGYVAFAFAAIGYWIYFVASRFRP